MAVCLGLTKYLDLLEDSISFLLILKNLQTTDCIKSIVTLFSPIFNKSFNTTLTSDKFGDLSYILEKETTLLIAPTSSLILVVISVLINFCISLYLTIDILTMYEKKSGKTINNPVFYYVFGLFKIAIIAQQIYYRYHKGYTKDKRFSMLNIAVNSLGVMANQAIIKNRVSDLFE